MYHHNPYRVGDANPALHAPRSPCATPAMKDLDICSLQVEAVRMQKDVPVDEVDRLAVEALCNRVGVRQAAEKLGMSRDSVLRVVARQPIRKGTLLVLKDALAKAGQEAG